MELKDLTKLQIKELNGMWESKYLNTITTYHFQDGQLTRTGSHLRPPTITETAKLNIFGEKVTLVTNSRIEDVELLTDKFLILQPEKGKFSLFVKFPIK